MITPPPPPPQDPLVALWQSGPSPASVPLVSDLKRQNAMHRRLRRSIFALLCGVGLLLIFEEGTGQLASHGILSAIWILYLIVAARRLSRADAPALDTVTLLKSMIAQAASDLFLARCLYIGVPCSAALSYSLFKIAGIGMSPADPKFHVVGTAAGLLALTVMTATGAILSRSRSRQLQDLKEKLRSLEASP